MGGYDDDMLQRFLLERAGIHGALVRLGASWREVASRAAYPRAVAGTLGEALAASALLTGQIKLDGALSLELKSSGALRLLFAECDDAGHVRGLARWSDPVPDRLALDALPDGLLAITIGNAERGQRYQGVVDLPDADLATAIERYFGQSEQLPARVVLAADDTHAVGLMLQRLPDSGGHDILADADAWPRVLQLTATLGARELLATGTEDLLYRLYHEESVRLFAPRPLAFGCSCSRERVAAMLRALGRDEADAALAARDGQVEVTCEFCARVYTFDRVDIGQLFSGGPAVPAPATHQ